MKKHLSIVGIVIGLSLVMYGRAQQSDLRILGYIILGPSILGALKKYTGLSLEDGHTATEFGVPDSGYSRPSRNAQARQETEPPRSMLPGRFSPPQAGARRYGGQARGAEDVTFEGPIFRPPGGMGGGK